MRASTLTTAPEIKIEDVIQDSPCGQCPHRCRMAGKEVFEIDTQEVLKFKSLFSHKLLCDGPTFSLGTVCVYRCAFCYVISMIEMQPEIQAILREIQKNGRDLKDVVIRRHNALDIIFRLLTIDKPKGVNLRAKQVVFTSPLVDPAANMTLARETAEACEMIFELTNWDVRVLSKSHLLPQVVGMVSEKFRHRLILGVSTGTLKDGLAKSFEIGTPPVSKRLESLHRMQDAGHRTYGMLCPILPQDNYDKYAEEALAAIRVDRCEHVWAEAINLRGDSLDATYKALVAGGFEDDAKRLKSVSGPELVDAWEKYARATFEALAKRVPAGKLRFLQYVDATNINWWSEQRSRGAVMLGSLME